MYAGFRVGFKIAGESGPLWLDAGGAEASHDANTPKNVLTDVTAPIGGADNVWDLNFKWSAKVGTATINDAAAANVEGPNVLRMNLDITSLKYKGIVLGRDVAAAPRWSIAAVDRISNLTSLPVCLSLNLPPSGAGDPAPCYLTPAQSPPSAQTVLQGQFGELSDAQRWTLQPFGTSVPTAAYTSLVVETFSVESMLVDIWNRCVGTEWARTYAPSLIAWMYDYPATWKAAPGAANGVNPKWMTDLTTRLYDKVYKPYFVENKPSFGEGDPPDDGPPPRMGGGHPPHKHG